MRLQHQASPVRKLLETPLAKPWHYRRSGVYYLRVRPLGSVASCTVSLRTTDKPTAMSTSKQLQAALRAFHLDNPDATWPELREQLRGLAEDLLASYTEWDELDALGLTYSELNEDLGRVERSAALSVPQAKAVSLAREIMTAAERRLNGDTGSLVRIIEKLNDSRSGDSSGLSGVPLSVSPPPASSSSAAPLTFRVLADLYMGEHKANVRESTMRDVTASCGVLAEALGDLDLRAHNRADLVRLKEKLLEDRKPSTVNKILTRLSTVLLWAVNTGHLERTYDKGLKIAGRASRSSRKAFSQDQVATVMAYANSLPLVSWERWGLTLGALTGARIEELRTLTTDDIKQVGNTWVIDINEEGGRGLKNRHSVRVVPLIDGAYGFDLDAFLGFVRGISGELLKPSDKDVPRPLFPVGAGRFSQVVNGSLQRVLGLEPKGDLSFHSFRHSLASLMKTEGVPVGMAEAILGHSSQSITFDLYGGNQRMAIEKLAAALELTFGSVQGQGETETP